MFRGCEGKLGFFSKKRYCLRTQLLRVCPVPRVHQIYGFDESFMFQSIPTGYIPPGNTRENFFERANPGHPGKIFV